LSPHSPPNFYPTIHPFRLCKDLSYYNTELSENEKKLQDPTITSDVQNLTKKLILETNRTIHHVQLQMEKILDEFEDVLKKFLEEFREQPDVIENSPEYILAKEVYEKLTEFGIDIDEGLFKGGE
jgi:hypothetical protein